MLKLQHMCGSPLEDSLEDDPHSICWQEACALDWQRRDVVRGAQLKALSSQGELPSPPQEDQERHGTGHGPAMKYEQVFVTPAAMQSSLLPTLPETHPPLPKGMCPTLLTQTTPHSPSILWPCCSHLSMLLFSMMNSGPCIYWQNTLLNYVLGPPYYLKWGDAKFPMLALKQTGQAMKLQSFSFCLPNSRDYNPVLPGMTLSRLLTNNCLTIMGAHPSSCDLPLYRKLGCTITQSRAV